MTSEVGALLRHARVKRGISLRSLAGEIGVSPSLISQVETGKTQPSVSTLYAISNFLGLSMDDLLNNDPLSDGSSPPAPKPTALTRTLRCNAPATTPRWRWTTACVGSSSPPGAADPENPSS